MNRLRSRLLLGGAACCLVVACQPPIASHSATDDVPRLPETGFGSFEVVSLDRQPLTVLVYRASRFDALNGPLWFVMHGASRNAERYVHDAAPVAERYDAMAIVIHFTKDDYPRSTDYTLGNPRFGRLPHLEVERAFEAVRSALGGRQKGYYLFGHSAGAQFVHRLLTFVPDASVLGAVAANAGWYTLPSIDGTRETRMPYGLDGGAVSSDSLGRLLDAPLTVLLGERDAASVREDRMLRDTPEAMAQGDTRLARGRNYHNVGRIEAKRRDLPFNWSLEIVPRAGHRAAQMIDSAGFVTFSPQSAPCRPSTAKQGAGLVITEILADPPKGVEGDANRDAVRDPAADEFVEFLNAGASPICLSGWAMGDAHQPDRHVFRLGSALMPGDRLVVFGGGIPTGEFDGAEVQWAEDGLGLSNDGDVIFVRDREDRIVKELSWGDCDGMPTATDHFSGSLALDGAIERAAESAPWLTPQAGEPRFTPGATR